MAPNPAQELAKRLSEPEARARRPSAVPATARAGSSSLALGEGPKRACAEEGDRQQSIEEVLPDAMLMEVLSHVHIARDLLNCAAVSHTFRAGFKQASRVWFLCRVEDVRQRDAVGLPPLDFKKTIVDTLEQMRCVKRLRLEIEDDVHMRGIKDDKVEKESLWLSKQTFIDRWLPLVKPTLSNLTIIDYGPQAIFHATPLLQLLSQHCNHLQALELRNMYLDCRSARGVQKMNKLTTLTLRCVKMTDMGLKELNICMPQLETLTLVTVVGLQQAEFESEYLKTMCLGLATPVKSVILKAPNLEKLQLKMACPEKLIVTARSLECLALCIDNRDKTSVSFQQVRNLRELLMGASDFSTLGGLSRFNPKMEKMFLDVPCMAFEDSGTWRGVLSNVTQGVPDMNGLRGCCQCLHTLSVGPGLWYAMEELMGTRPPADMKWPALKRLIVHLIVQFKPEGMAMTLGLLTAVVNAVGPSLAKLEIYVHTDSRVGADEFLQLRPRFPRLDLKCDSWKKGLRFECFSF